MAQLISKQGRHGTLYRYAVVYTDSIDRDGFGESTWHCWAYNAEHAIEQFFDNSDGDSWEPLRYCRLVDAPSHRQHFHAV